MNINQLKKTARGVKTLSNLIGYQAILRYCRTGIGLETVNLAKLPAKRFTLIAPHPDDDVFGLGGTLAQLNRLGAEISIIYLSNGSRGNRSGRYEKDLIGRRQREAEAAIKILGGAKMEFWQSEDGALAPSAPLINKMIAALRQQRPEILFVPWSGESNDDHHQTFKLISAVLKKFLPESLVEIWQYEVWSPLVPNRLVPIGAVAEIKKRAAAAHISQAQTRDFGRAILGFNTYRGAMNALDEPAEAFFALPAKDFLDFNRTILYLPC